MDDKASIRVSKAHIEALHRNRALLIQQIRQSHETIRRSQELLKRLDDLLPKVDDQT